MTLLVSFQDTIKLGGEKQKARIEQEGQEKEKENQHVDDG